MKDFLVLGFTGLMGSGKSSIARLLEENFKYKVIRLGEYLRSSIKADDHYINVLETEALKMKEKSKFKSLGEFFIDEINQSMERGKVLIVDSIRTREDVEFFRSVSKNFKIIIILANQRLRFNRILSRAREFDPKNFADFQKHDNWEMEFGIKNIFPQADKFIVNEGDISSCYNSVIKYLREV